MTVKDQATNIIHLATAILAMAETTPEGQAISYLAAQIDEQALLIQHTAGADRLKAATEEEVDELCCMAVRR